MPKKAAVGSVRSHVIEVAPEKHRRANRHVPTPLIVVRVYPRKISDAPDPHYSVTSGISEKITKLPPTLPTAMGPPNTFPFILFFIISIFLFKNVDA